MTYLNVQGVDNVVVNLAALFPGTSQLITLPHQTEEGRTSHAIRLGGGAVGSRNAVVLLGGVHAREWGSCEILLNFAIDLLRAYQANSGLTYGGMVFSAQQIRTMLDTLHIVVFPLANPDGRHHSQRPGGEYMWRKNRNPDYCVHHEDCSGVDINRNFDFLFDYRTAFDVDSEVMVTDDPCDHETYQGPHAFSEPETRNVQWLLDAHARTRWFVDVHSYGDTIMYSWGNDKNQTTTPTQNFRNAAWDGQRGLANDPTYGEYIAQADLTVGQNLAQAFCAAVLPVRNRAYTPKPSFDLYPTAGASDDYTFSRHFVYPGRQKVYSFTVEFGQQFVAPMAEMQNIIQDVSAGLIGLCLAAPATVPAEPGDKPAGDKPTGPPSGGPFHDPDTPASGTGSPIVTTPVAVDVAAKKK
ncbi:carboxypeptidase [Actinoplanes sp. ATCC 53533]|uniref:M14 family metallopeptidase n=1 Tax=Actinoplanes sp. ATCC 53533 TaxID=1288362 RepID=UPI000F7860E0|nr:M14 family metallopeptidase [Actinoplanes sp. ATCC 53533]RSM57732.1 carboxypeptidase [Actinoplanes sp. ATCC 53533]